MFTTTHMTTDIMTTPQDALDELTQLPPALVDAVQDNPEAIQPLARGMAAINLYNLYKRVQEGNSNKDLLELQVLLNKMTGMEKAQVATVGGGPQVVINITRARDSSQEIIEGVAVTLPEAGDAQD